MPYDYRDLTAEERAAVVEERRRRGYPLHGPPHPYRGVGWYCISAANYDHAHVMGSADRLSAFEDQLLLELTEAGAELGAWVILTNHYHFLARLKSLDQVSSTVPRLRRPDGGPRKQKSASTANRVATSRQH